MGTASLVINVPGQWCYDRWTTGALSSSYAGFSTKVILPEPFSLLANRSSISKVNSRNIPFKLFSRTLLSNPSAEFFCQTLLLNCFTKLVATLPFNFHKDFGWKCKKNTHTHTQQINMKLVDQNKTFSSPQIHTVSIRSLANVEANVAAWFYCDRESWIVFKKFGLICLFLKKFSNSRELLQSRRVFNGVPLGKQFF